MKRSFCPGFDQPAAGADDVHSNVTTIARTLTIDVMALSHRDPTLAFPIFRDRDDRYELGFLAHRLAECRGCLCTGDRAVFRAGAPFDRRRAATFGQRGWRVAAGGDARYRQYL